jgi:putative thioredoxin
MSDPSTSLSPIRDVSESTFEAEVVARSHRVPVVVDFWAAWCGPCRQLTPVLEEAVTMAAGRVELAKVDVDANPGLAQRFQVSGIPRVIAFHKGKVIGGFEGAQAKAQVARFLFDIVPSPDLEAAEEALAAGDAEAARRAIDKIDPRSQAALRVPELERRLGFLVDAAAAGGLEAAQARLAADPTDLDARWAVASAYAAAGRTAEAAKELLSIIAKSRKYRDDGAREALLALLATAEEELARDVRRQLQIIL